MHAHFMRLTILLTGCMAARAAEPTPAMPSRMGRMDDARYKDWLDRWSAKLAQDCVKYRYCDKDNGEGLGWHVSPYLNGFYYGYLATEDTQWIDRMVDWADSVIKRGVKGPDGYIGWPRVGAAGTLIDRLDDFYNDSLLGEAMAFRPIVLMAGEILKNPALKEKYGSKADGYLKTAEELYEKWDKRGFWRETKDGGTWLVLPYGIDKNTNQWTEGYEKRNDPAVGFSYPCNKNNHTARWLLALYDVTKKPLYRDRAEKWFRQMKAWMKPQDNGTYAIWSYWNPAGPWDFKPDGKRKHFVGVHKAGYYYIDNEGIVDAFEHGLVFTREDIDRLAATALAEKRYWTALVPFNEELRKHFEENHKPDSWEGVSGTPWYLALQKKMRAVER